MSDLVAQHRQKLALGVPGQEVIRDPELPVEEQLQQKGVLRGGLFRLVINIDLMHLLLRALLQPHDLVAQRPFRERRERVAQPQDPVGEERRQHEEQGNDSRDHRAGQHRFRGSDRPASGPHRKMLSEERQDHAQDPDQQERSHGLDDLVLRELAAVFLIQSVLLLDPERVVPAEDHVADGLDRPEHQEREQEDHIGVPARGALDRTEERREPDGGVDDQRDDPLHDREPPVIRSIVQIRLIALRLEDVGDFRGQRTPPLQVGQPHQDAAVGEADETHDEDKYACGHDAPSCRTAAFAASETNDSRPE